MSYISYDTNTENTAIVFCIGAYFMYIKKIKELRIAKKITQVEMSKKLGLSESTYGLYETNQRQMDIETFIEICKILDASPNELLGFI